MQHIPLACFLSLIRPPGITFEDSYLQILPVDKAKCPFVRDHSDITIRLYTRHNPVVYQELHIDDDESLFASHMDFNDPTVIYFTAFLEQPDDGSGLSVREAYMLRGDTNFIIFDLSRLEAGPWYFTAAENTWYIGNFAAKLIDYLVSRGMDLKKTHLVGHSLGAQSAGVAGSVIKSGRISRITGLDPAFPLFDKLPLLQRLDPSDAEFVDVIHTDAGIFGFNRPTGHVDFYPNGGISPQPGCELEVVLHEQRLLNNCEGHTQLQGYYIFHLDTKKQNNLEQNIIQFFRHIDNLKKSNANTHDTPYTQKAVEKELKAINTQGLKEPHAEHKEKRRTKNKKEIIKSKPKPRVVKQNSDNLKQSSNTELQLLHETQDKATYKRDKRISVADKRYVNTATTLSNVDNTKIVDEEEIDNKKNNAVGNKPAEIPTQFELVSTAQKKKDKKYSVNMPNTDEDIRPKDTERANVTVEENITQSKTVHRYNDKTDIVGTNANTSDIENPNGKNFAANYSKDLLRNARTSDANRDGLKRQKRFVSWFRNNNGNNEESFLLKMLEFLVRNRKNVIPVVTVMREINTLVKSANGELNHSSKERNNYIGAPPQFIPITYDLELGNDSRAMAFVKRLLGLGVKGGKLTISGSGK